MTLIAAATRNDTDLFKRVKALEKDLGELRKIAEAQQQQINRLLGGSSHPAGLSLSPPLVYIQINVSLDDARYRGKQVRIQYSDFATEGFIVGKWVDVDEDKPDGFESSYLVEASPWTPHIFHDSINLCAMAYRRPHLTDPTLPDITVYRAIAGEGMGFAAVIDGPPEASAYGPIYPWTQIEVHPDDALSDTTIGFNDQPLGKARMLSAAAFDPQITAARIAFPEGTKVWLRATQYYGEFVFSGYAETVHAGCPS